MRRGAARAPRPTRGRAHGAAATSGRAVAGASPPRRATIPRRMQGSPVDRRPFVSVIVAARDAEHAIAPLLAALSAQTFPRDRFEVVIVDDASRDRTVETIRATTATRASSRSPRRRAPTPPATARSSRRGRRHRHHRRRLPAGAGLARAPRRRPRPPRRRRRADPHAAPRRPPAARPRRRGAPARPAPVPRRGLRRVRQLRLPPLAHRRGRPVQRGPALQRRPRVVPAGRGDGRAVRLRGGRDRRPPAAHARVGGRRVLLATRRRPRADGTRRHRPRGGAREELVDAARVRPRRARPAPPPRRAPAHGRPASRVAPPQHARIDAATYLLAGAPLVAGYLAGTVGAWLSRARPAGSVWRPTEVVEIEFNGVRGRQA